MIINDGSRNSLLTIIQSNEYPEEGFEIHTRVFSESWDEYLTDDLEEMGYFHRAVIQDLRSGVMQHER